MALENENNPPRRYRDRHTATLENVNKRPIGKGASKFPVGIDIPLVAPENENKPRVVIGTDVT